MSSRVWLLFDGAKAHLDHVLPSLSIQGQMVGEEGKHLGSAVGSRVDAYYLLSVSCLNLGI